MGMSELWHSRFKRGIYEADSSLPHMSHGQGRGLRINSPHGAEPAAYCITYPQKGIGAAEAAVQLCCRLGVIAAVAAGYEVIWVRGCDRYAAVGW